MASEEQINNQSRFNDLQRDSKELLSDYQQGIRESSEFVSVLTTRSSQLVDVLKDTVSQKSKSSQADKDLISSITKINSLAKGFATPYTDAGKAIRVASAPIDAELTGPWFSPDGKTLFLSVQHPGDETKDIKNPTSKFPFDADGIPKPTVVAIQGDLIEKMNFLKQIESS